MTRRFSPGTCVFIASAMAALAAGCSRRPAEPVSPPQPAQAEIPADASIRLITDPLPATPPRDAGAALLPIGNASAGDPMQRMIAIPPDASAAPIVPR
jgi:hypothetical protein